MIAWSSVFSFFATGSFYGLIFAFCIHYFIVSCNFKHIENID